MTAGHGVPFQYGKSPGFRKNPLLAPERILIEPTKRTHLHTHTNVGPIWEYDGFGEKNPGYHIWRCRRQKCCMTMIQPCGMVFNFPPRCSTCDAHK